MKTHFRYIIKLQYLGFRFHGWAKQKDLKTIHHMVDKTLDFVLKENNYKSMGSSRTDAMVSANSALLQVLTENELDPNFLKVFNLNLPPDIRALSVDLNNDPDFNIIQTPKTKEYLYLFASHDKPHPFSTSLVASFPFDLDLKAMQEGAKAFVGTHNLVNFCTKPSENTNFTRTIDQCEIVPNEFFTASFFPEESFAMVVRSKGFMRNQVRLMMGQLLLLGKGELEMNIFLNSLSKKNESPFKYIAPSSGLILNQIAVG